jgi:hypothetical protein
VAVAAPPPRLTSRVTDKIWFANQVREVLVPDALPPTFAAFGPAVKHICGKANQEQGPHAEKGKVKLHSRDVSLNWPRNRTRC